MGNNVLELKGKRFFQATRPGKGGGASMNGKKIVTSEKLVRLKEKIMQIKDCWIKDELETLPLGRILNKRRKTN